MCDEWRDSYAQSKYRAQSSSANKDTQHVSHQFSLEVAKHIDDGIPGPTAAQNKAAVNHTSNFYMKSATTNQKIDRKLDSAIISKAESGATLTVREESRARIQVEQVMQGDYSAAFKAGAKSHYKSLSTKSGKTLWDDRKSY